MTDPLSRAAASKLSDYPHRPKSFKKLKDLRLHLASWMNLQGGFQNVLPVKPSPRPFRWPARSVTHSPHGYIIAISQSRNRKPMLLLHCWPTCYLQIATPLLVLVLLPSPIRRTPTHPAEPSWIAAPSVKASQSACAGGRTSAWATSALASLLVTHHLQ